MTRHLGAVLKSQFRNPGILKAKPSLLLFLLKYMGKFNIQKIGRNLILHSHLPPINSRAYGRFVKEHLVGRIDGPSHAQIGLTNECPQKCAYCYNRGRRGTPMGKEDILRTIRDLQKMGVFWFGWTGGEPLLNKDIVEITEKASEGSAVKLFTTGCTLTPRLAARLKAAGLFSVSVSLDHWQEEIHDRQRGYPGAFQTALRAIDIFKNTPGLHVGVSAVLTREMLKKRQTEEFLEFLESLGIHEAWLSEAKPSVASFSNDDLVISEAERISLVNLQDRHNRKGGMTVNYLGHFEGSEHFGCNAGHKMVYIDAFGDVSPCVFTPMNFGNILETNLMDIVRDMRRCFPSENRCFINKNHLLFRTHSKGDNVLSSQQSFRMMAEVEFGPMARFFQLFYGKKRGKDE